MISLKHFNVVLCIGLGLTHQVYGRKDPLLEPYSEHTINPIPRAYILYQRKVWRKMSLEQKQNLPYFTQGKEISKVIIDGVKKGLLKPYYDDSLKTEMPMEKFLQNLIPPSESNQPDDEFVPSEISVLNIVEYILLNKITAKKEYAIESIQLQVPSHKNAPTYLDHNIATFKYKDLVNYFNSLPVDEVRWYHPTNTAEIFTWTDALNLRLFNARIVKVENAENMSIDENYTDNKDKNDNAILASQRAAIQLDLEFEHFLSEY